MGETMAETVAVNQYLTFQLGEEVYAFPVAHVQEVLEMGKITKIPHMPTYMVGVLNNRGTVLPVIDLRAKFNLDTSEDTVDTAIVVVEVPQGDRNILLGCKTDAVDQVVDILPDQIEPSPKVGTSVQADFIQGIGNIDDTFVIILDIQNVFGADELEAIAAKAE